MDLNGEFFNLSFGFNLEREEDRIIRPADQEQAR